MNIKLVRSPESASRPVVQAGPDHVGDAVRALTALSTENALRRITKAECCALLDAYGAFNAAREAAASRYAVARFLEDRGAA